MARQYPKCGHCWEVCLYGRRSQYARDCFSSTHAEGLRWAPGIRQLGLCALVTVVLVLTSFGLSAEVVAAPTQPQASQAISPDNLRAFLDCLSVPGKEHTAAKLGLRAPDRFLVELDEVINDSDNIQIAPRALLVRGDLLLATGQKERALESYVQVTNMFTDDPDTGWEQGFVPRDYYFIEIPQTGDLNYREWLFQQEVKTFTLGCGSHRDNWLIRRFIGLGAWDDAAREFSRIWAIHRRFAGDEQFLGLGLQFAIHYAYFLKKQVTQEAAFEVLMEPSLRVDMDKKPAIAGPGSSGYGARAPATGISRREFLRLAYRELNSVAEEARLLSALRGQIAAGENRARRVLAQVLVDQGDTAGARELELAYIETAGFDELTSAYRLGLVYEGLQEFRNAAIEYERVIDMPYSQPQLADGDEGESETQRMMPLVFRGRDSGSPGAHARFQIRLLDRLGKLYGRLGEPEKILPLTLKQFEANPFLLEDLDRIEQAARQYRALEKEREFDAWARKYVATLDSPTARANVWWVLGDHAQAARALADGAQDMAPQLLYSWRERFRVDGRETFPEFLAAVLAAKPNDASARLELLNLQEQLYGPAAIEALEMILAQDAGPAFVRFSKGSRNQTQFRNYFDLVYRLMRLYEKNGDMEKLQALGLRLASGDTPFKDVQDAWTALANPGVYLWEKSRDLNDCLSLLIQYADQETMTKLDSLMATMPENPVKEQLARRRAGRWQQDSGPAIGWANLPEGVAAFVSDENVQCLANDERYVYAGMPWGLAVYTHDGESVTRIALGDVVTEMAVFNRHVWLAMPESVYRVNPDDWAVARVSNGAQAIAVDGDTLWFGGNVEVRCYNPGENKLQIFGADDLFGYKSWNSIIVEADHIWAQGYDGLLRYNKRDKVWQRVFLNGANVYLTGLGKNEVWGHLNVNDEIRNRPCLIDRETLTVTPIYLGDELPPGRRGINEPFIPTGIWDDHLVFGNGYYLDRSAMKIHRKDIPSKEIHRLRILRVSRGYSYYDCSIADLDSLNEARFAGRPGDPTTFRSDGIILGNGSFVYGGRISAPPIRYTDDIGEEKGGLYWVSPTQERRRITGHLTADTLPADAVLSLLFDPKGPNWACTNQGVAGFDDTDTVQAHFSRKNGFVGNVVHGGVVLGDKAYFATGWDDHEGGLAVFDPQTRVFTALYQSDGLATNKLAGVEILGTRLKLQYDYEYMRYSDLSGKYRLHPPGIFYPESATVRSGGEAEFLEGKEADAAKNARAKEIRSHPMPYLGGYILSRQEHDGKTYLCGSRGLVILRGEATLPLEVGDLQATEVVSEQQRLLVEAKEFKLPDSITPEELEELLRSDNPYIRADGLAAATRSGMRNERTGYTKIAGAYIDDPFYRVRATAVVLLSRTADKDAIVPLELALNDADLYVRSVAALALVSHGRIPAMVHFENILATRDFGNLPFGATGSFGVLADSNRVYRALAPHSNPAVFELFMEYPPSIRAADYETTVYPALGEALLRHPEAADLLLRAHDFEGGGTSNRDFAQHVFRFAGAEMLPMLHDSLASEDPVPRSNAARACGAIGDGVSIPYLIQALDLDGELSQASIVWALGELKALESLPQLAKLYVDVQIEEQRRWGPREINSPFISTISADHGRLDDLDDIESEWDELKAIADAGKPVQKEDEMMIRSADILKAVGQIGASGTDEFWRTMAGESNIQARWEAAKHLCEGEEKNRQTNLSLLRSLLADSVAQVRVAAAVSLLILGEDIAQKSILESLESSNSWEKKQVLMQLRRVEESDKLTFARPSLERIAGDEMTETGVRTMAGKLLRATPIPRSD